MGKEQYILQLSMLEQESNHLQQQMQLIEQQNLELQTLQIGLRELEKTKEKKMLANLGKGIFIKTQIENKELIVDVGNKTFVQKNIPETLKVIDEQLEKLLEAKKKVLMKMQELQHRMQEIVAQAEGEK